MSRSIHDTRRFLFEALNDDYADPELRSELVQAARHNLRQQRSIKTHVRQQRRARTVALPLLDPESVPILMRDEGPFVHHAVTEEDLRAVMRRLPPGTLDGLGAIELGLGGEDHGGEARDPYTGRSGRELLPGVYVGHAAGAYAKEVQTILLFSPVYELGAAMPGPLAIALKLLGLVAFLREAAHHFDSLFRVGGSRWRRDDQDKSELYASRRESLYAAHYAIPYLEERYPAECAALAGWMRHHGGAALPLSVLVERERDRRSGQDAPGFRALRVLTKAILDGKDLARTRISFAQALHQAGYPDFAMAAVARVLADQPTHPEALSVRAAVAVSLGEHGLAEFICRGVLAAAPRCAAARAVLCRVYREQRRWSELAACATEGLSLSDSDSRQLAYRAQALLALGRWDELTADLAVLRMGGSGSEQAQRTAEVLHALMLVHRAQWGNALDAANRMLAQPEFAGARAELAAVRYESAQRLGRPHAAGSLTERQVKALRAAGHEAWVERLIAECGLIPLPIKSRSGRR